MTARHLPVRPDLAQLEREAGQILERHLERDPAMRLIEERGGK